MANVMNFALLLASVSCSLIPVAPIHADEAAPVVVSECIEQALFDAADRTFANLSNEASDLADHEIVQECKIANAWVNIAEGSSAEEWRAFVRLGLGINEERGAVIFCALLISDERNGENGAVNSSLCDLPLKQILGD